MPSVRSGWRAALAAAGVLSPACGSDNGGPAADAGTVGITLDGGGSMAGATESEGATGGPAGDGTQGSTTPGPADDTVGGESPVKFDLGIVPDAGGAGSCSGGGGDPGRPAFSYIWIANSVEGTVSKIDTETGVEVGRFVSGPNVLGLGDVNNGPSRTSVNLYGDAAVANRNGGITKIAAQEMDCVDKNANGVIDTSTGPADVLPWGEDECVLWHHPTPTDPLAFNEGPRPLAWVGEVDAGGCPTKNPPLWFGYYDLDQNLGLFERLDGATGTTTDMAMVPWSGQNWGPYGGAVNQEGDFFVVGWSQAFVVRIDAATLTPTVYQPPGFVSFYGMAMDAAGDVWVTGCGDSNIYHLDPDTSTWTTVGQGPGCMRGIQVDTMGRAFAAHNGFPGGLVVVDTLTQSIVAPNVPLAGSQTPVGVSIDVEGYVWVVDQGGWAYKVDPDTYQVQLQVTGLNQPYTYSDMTGAGLNLVSFPPTG